MDGTLSISRSGLAGESTIRIEIIDVASRERVTITLSASAFGEAVTGLSGAGCDIKVGKPERIGKVREMMSIKVPVDSLDKDLAKEEITKATPEGWNADTSLRSRNSMVRQDGQIYAQTTAYRWVPAS